MEIQHFRQLQREYGEKECPECEGTMTLFVDSCERLFECCHNANCGFEEAVDEDEI